MRLWNRLTAVALILVITSASTGCEESAAPELPSRIRIVSGDGQYTKVGTQMQFPLVVRLFYADGSAAMAYRVEFAVANGDASLSTGASETNGQGDASTMVTAGAALGTIRVRATISGTNNSVLFELESGDFFCPEEDPSFSPDFISDRLLLATRFSSLNTQAGSPVSGIVRLDPGIGQVAPQSVRQFDEEFSLVLPWDIAPSRSGDVYLVQTDFLDEILKVENTGSTAHFATMEAIGGLAEVAPHPATVLAGCDAMGPFVIGCRDTLMRFDEASYTGDGTDKCNDDAVAVHPTTGDIFFIDLSDNTLRRLPMTDITPSGPSEVLATLTSEEANGVNGMACNDAGDIYLLVESNTVKAILVVNTSGTPTVSTLVDFFSRGAGAAAGVQSDLALNDQFEFLYTVDTENDLILLFDVGQDNLFELVPTIADAVSQPGTSGERVGLMVTP